MTSENKQNFDAGMVANLVMNIIDGRLQQFVRSDFKRSPLENWDEQWRLLHNLLIID